ncbi:MAG TPA: plasmid pRiA4b ORF-3 family protein [Thermoanaerobacterales bacterium]|nr:plasmid pRiA4b ORF-3 family protein [Thermoanaerobacterales bacterium]
MSHRHTLYDLHIAIQDAFGFYNDHLYAFYIGGTRRTGKPIYCADVEDYGGGKTTEETTIEDLGLYKGQKIYYLFDFGDMWEFELNLIKIDKNLPLPLRPIIIEEKGEAPLQYPIWE